MRKLSLLLFCLFACAASARADVVTFTSSGQFEGGDTSATSGGVTVTYTPGALTSVTTVGTTVFAAPFGSLLVTGSGTFAPTQFTLTVTQTSPTAESIAFTGTISGTVGLDLSFVVTPRAEIVGPLGPDGHRIAYYFPGDVFVGPDNPFIRTDTARFNLSAGTNEIVGNVQAVPEPATMLLLGTGLAGVVLRRRRRQR